MMINMVSLRNFTLRTTLGHSVEFKANQSTPVPQVIVGKAMEAGCVPVDAEDRPFIDNVTRTQTEFVGNLRASLLYKAVEVVIDENNVKNFDAAGMPKADVISARVGFDIDNAERVQAYRTFMEAKHNDIDFKLHPNTEKVLEVLNAEDRKRLTSIAATIGLEKAKLDGMQTSDMRKLLIQRLNDTAG